nr:MAG TPA: hypothetical protein [Caudoviricetes sp.]
MVLTKEAQCLSARTPSQSLSHWNGTAPLTSI